MMQGVMLFGDHRFLAAQHSLQLYSSGKALHSSPFGFPNGLGRFGTLVSGCGQGLGPLGVGQSGGFGQSFPLQIGGPELSPVGSTDVSGPSSTYAKVFKPPRNPMGSLSMYLPIAGS